jgi:tripartite-type tricarboxylate transporter receptor subunit TctC
VRLVIGFPAGSPADVTGRLFAQSFSERLGQPLIIDNRPGAAGNIGAEFVVKAPPDGYTLLLVTAAYTTNASLYRNTKFDFVHDVEPVGGVVIGSFVLIANPSFPATTVSELIAYAKANPRRVNFASSGVGSPPHIFGALFEMMTGVELVHVPYAGNYLPDVLSGQVQIAFSPIATPVGFIQSGKLRALGVTSAQPSAALPDVPTIGATVKGYEAGGWIGIGAPRGMSSDLVEKLNQQINSVLDDTSFDERVAPLGVIPMRMSPSQFGKFIAEETDKWAKVIEFAGIRPS